MIIINNKVFFLYNEDYYVEQDKYFQKYREYLLLKKIEPRQNMNSSLFSKALAARPKIKKVDNSFIKDWLLYKNLLYKA